jgi:hypothetical protein
VAAEAKREGHAAGAAFAASEAEIDGWNMGQTLAARMAGYDRGQEIAQSTKNAGFPFRGLFDQLKARLREQ